MIHKQPAHYELIADYLKELVTMPNLATVSLRRPSCARSAVRPARQAVQVVANDGLIHAHPVPRDLGSPLSFSGSMRARIVMPRDLALGEDFQSGPLHEAFRSVGCIPTDAHSEVSTRRATKEERDLLGLPPLGIIISEERTIYDQEDRPLERTETRYAASRYTCRAILRESEEGR